METIIKKAIEGGWKRHYNMPTHPDIFLADVGNYEYQIVLDPLFWQSLGKACGWKIETKGSGFGDNVDVWEKYEWLTYAKEFHEINLTEGWEKAVEYLESITQDKK